MPITSQCQVQTLLYSRNRCGAYMECTTFPPCGNEPRYSWYMLFTYLKMFYFNSTQLLTKYVYILNLPLGTYIQTYIFLIWKFEISFKDTLD